MLSSVSQVSATTDAFKCLVDFFPPIFYAKTQQGSLNAAIIKSPFTNSLKKKKVTNMCKTMRQAECICSVQCSWVLCFISCLFFYYFFFPGSCSSFVFPMLSTVSGFSRLSAQNLCPSYICTFSEDSGTAFVGFWVQHTLWLFPL